MFAKASTENYQQVLDKIEMKTLVYGKTTSMSEFRLRKGAKLPRHSHPHEQTGYLVSGRMELTIGEETFQVDPGDSWSIGGEVEHQAIVLEDSVAVEIFSPPREDYIAS